MTQQTKTFKPQTRGCKTTACISNRSKVFKQGHNLCAARSPVRISQIRGAKASIASPDEAKSWNVFTFDELIEKLV